MMKNTARFLLSISLGLAILGVTLFSPSSSAELPERVDPTVMPAIGQVDKRFQAYNIEMLEVTGGKFGLN
jgi:heparanase 1